MPRYMQTLDDLDRELEKVRLIVAPKHLEQGHYPHLEWVPFYQGWVVRWKEKRKVEEFKTLDKKEAWTKYIALVP